MRIIIGDRKKRLENYAEELFSSSRHTTKDSLEFIATVNSRQAHIIFYIIFVLANILRSRLPVHKDITQDISDFKTLLIKLAVKYEDNSI